MYSVTHSLCHVTITGLPVLLRMASAHQRQVPGVLGADILAGMVGRRWEAMYGSKASSARYSTERRPQRYFLCRLTRVFRLPTEDADTLPPVCGF